MPGIRITYSKGKRRRPMPSGVVSLADLARRRRGPFVGGASPSTVSRVMRLLGRSHWRNTVSIKG